MTTTKRAAKAAKTTSRKTTTRKTAAGKPAAVALPRQRTKAQSAAAAAPAAPPVAAPRRARPLIKLATRRGDGRAVSYSERLSEKMHARLNHAGPVCHNCRSNASHLAALAAGPSPLAP